MSMPSLLPKRAVWDPRPERQAQVREQAEVDAETSYEGDGEHA
jgi:hypothetical protein